MNATGLDNLSRASSSIFHIMAEVLPELSGTNPEMARDIFSAFYQTEPPIVKVEGADWTNDLRLLIDMGIFPKMRRLTRRDATMAAMASLSAIEAITAWHIIDEMDGESTPSEISGDAQGVMYQDLMEIAELRDKLPDTSEGQPGGSGGEGETGGSDGSDEGSGGGGESEQGLDLASITTESSIRIQLLAMLRDDEHLANVFKIFGQLKDVASEIYKDNIFSSRDSSTYDIGGDISRVPVSEIVKPLDILGRDLANDEAMQHSNDEEGTKGEGPLALLIDISGSMGMMLPDDQIAGTSETRLDFAIALGLVLQHICNEQGRHLMIQMFNHANQAFIDCPDGKFSPTTLNQLIRTTPMGGTGFRGPIKKALDWIGEHSYEDKADIVMLTDGCGGETWGDYSTDWGDYYKELPQHTCEGTVCPNCFGDLAENNNGISDMLDYWMDKKSDIERMGVRFWGLQIGRRMDRALAYISTRIFTGLASIENREEACKSVLREMIEIRKPTWLK